MYLPEVVADVITEKFSMVCARRIFCKESRNTNHTSVSVQGVGPYESDNEATHGVSATGSLTPDHGLSRRTSLHFRVVWRSGQ